MNANICLKPNVATQQKKPQTSPDNKLSSSDPKLPSQYPTMTKYNANLSSEAVAMLCNSFPDCNLEEVDDANMTDEDVDDDVLQYSGLMCMTATPTHCRAHLEYVNAWFGSTK